MVTKDDTLNFLYGGNSEKWHLEVAPLSSDFKKAKFLDRYKQHLVLQNSVIAIAVIILFADLSGTN